jgi:hypothetical protein
MDYCNMYHIVLFSTTFLVGVQLMSKSVQACNSSALVSCLGNGLIRDLYERFANHSMFPVYDNITLDNICSRMTSPNGARCVEVVNTDCQNLGEVRMFQGSVQSTEFLCGRGRHAYILNRDCYALPVVINRGQGCHGNYTAQLVEIERAGSSLKSPSDICRVIDEFVDCIRLTVLDECNLAASHWIFQLKKINFAPIKDQMNCDRLTVEVSELIGVAILFSLGLISISLITIVLLVCRHRRILDQRQQRRLANTSVLSKQQQQQCPGGRGHKFGTAAAAAVAGADRVVVVVNATSSSGLEQQQQQGRCCTVTANGCKCCCSAGTVHTTPPPRVNEFVEDIELKPVGK